MLVLTSPLPFKFKFQVQVSSSRAFMVQWLRISERLAKLPVMCSSTCPRASLMPRPHPCGEGLVTSGWFLGLHYKFIAFCMHSCELLTHLLTKKVLCHCVEVVKNFQCCNHRLCFLQCDWHEQNSSLKSNQLNEARGIGQCSILRCICMSMITFLCSCYLFCAFPYSLRYM